MTIPRTDREAAPRSWSTLSAFSSLCRKGGLLLLFAALSGTLSGCRFGNRVEEAVRPRGYSGYYRTAPQTLTFCSIHSSTDCAQAPVNQIPSLIANVMTNPIALISRDDTGSSAYLAASDESGFALPTLVDVASSSLSYVGQTSPVALWDDPACTTRLYVDEAGSFTQSTSAGTLAGKPLSGTLAITLSITRTIDGNCTASLTAMKSCYENESQCGGADSAENANLHEAVVAFFDPFIQAGVLPAANLTQASVLAYEVRYE
jgi:hypothetical protein